MIIDAKEADEELVFGEETNKKLFFHLSPSEEESKNKNKEESLT